MKLAKLIVITGSYANMVLSGKEDAVIVVEVQGSTTVNMKEFGDSTVLIID